MLSDRATLVTGFSPAALPEAMNAAGGPFDLVLIDGDHTRAGVLRDADGVLPFVASGASLLFHDCHNPDVRNGIDDFARRHANRLADAGPLTREITLHQNPDGSTTPWGGLRLIEVRGRQ